MLNIKRQINRPITDTNDETEMSSDVA